MNCVICHFLFKKEKEKRRYMLRVVVPTIFFLNIIHFNSTRLSHGQSIKMVINQFFKVFTSPRKKRI